MQQLHSLEVVMKSILGMLEWAGGSIHLRTSCIEVSDHKRDELLLNQLCGWSWSWISGSVPTRSRDTDICRLTVAAVCEAAELESYFKTAA